nr:unnamed protein product [Callosobruchus chinensis]
MLRDSTAANLENLSSLDLRDYGKITSALKLRIGNVHSTELLFGQLHNRTQQAKDDLTTMQSKNFTGRFRQGSGN